MESTHVAAVLKLVSNALEEVMLHLERCWPKERRRLVVQHLGLDLPRVPEPLLHDVRHAKVGVSLSAKHALRPLGDLPSTTKKPAISKSAFPSNKKKLCPP